jgi:hypothetical protein
VDAPLTGTTAPSTAQGALWMVLASGAVGVPPTSKGRHRSQRHGTSQETQIVTLPTQWGGGANALPTDCGRAPNRDHRPKHRTGCAMDGVGKRCGGCAPHKQGAPSVAAAQDVT